MNWIPVSEQLPEELGSYLATIFENDETKVIVVLWDRFLCGELGFWTWDSWAGIEGRNVTAWAELPKPYEVESESNMSTKKELEACKVIVEQQARRIKELEDAVNKLNNRIRNSCYQPSLSSNGSWESMGG